MSFDVALCRDALRSLVLHGRGVRALAALGLIAAGCSDGGPNARAGALLPLTPPDAAADAQSDDAEAHLPSSSATDEPAMVALALTACPFGDYSATLTIGASQTFSLVVDTGSTTLGVAAAACTTCDGVSPVYSPGSSAQNEDMTASSQYVTGDWSGAIYEDSVAVSSATSADVKLVAIDSQKDFFETIECGQGVVGLARAPAALSGTTGFFDDLVAKTGMADVFALELCPSGGTLWLGGFDRASVTSPPAYVPFSSSVYSAYYYVVNLASITVMGQTVAVASADYADAIVDTGTNGLIVNTSAYAAITSAIVSSTAFQHVFGAEAGKALFSLGGSGDTAASETNGDVDAGISGGSGCVADDKTGAELDSLLPPLTLTFGPSPGVSIQVTATEGYLTPGAAGEWCSSISAVSPASTFPFDGIVGAPVMRSNVVVFDRDHNRLGFAPHAPCP
jgi:Eukaryotic aspartyl protease